MLLDSVSTGCGHCWRRSIGVIEASRLLDGAKPSPRRASLAQSRLHLMHQAKRGEISLKILYCATRLRRCPLNYQTRTKGMPMPFKTNGIPIFDSCAA